MNSKHLAASVLCLGLNLMTNAWGLTLQEVAANRDLWPDKITLTTETPLRLSLNGKPAGSMPGKTGMEFDLVSVTETNLVLEAKGVTAEISPSHTDLLARAETKQLQQSTIPTPNFAPQTPMPSTKPVESIPTPAATPNPTPAATISPIAKALEGNLTVVDKKKFGKFDDSKLADVKYYGIYFSAHWCPPCQKFTPDLVSFYKKQRKKHPEFEIVFVSNDKSEEAMEKYMIETDMPWPAVKYKNDSNIKELDKIRGRGIPCLVLIDSEGKVLCHTYEGDQFLGPTNVMKYIDRILNDKVVEIFLSTRD